MTESDRHRDQPPTILNESPPKLEYGRQPRRWRRELTPEQERRLLLWCVGVTLAGEFAWWTGMFCARRPAIDYFCVCGFLPLILAAVWVVLGSQLVSLMRRYPQPRRIRLVAVILLAFFLAPYSLMRAGSDMFTLSLRYHLWRAGGSEKVRAAFNRWVASRPVYDPSNGRKMLFYQVMPNGMTVRLPVTRLPREVRYIDERFPSRFGSTWQGVAYLDNVSVLTTTDIMIGPPGWEPEGGATVWQHVLGSRRKLADGIWVRFGTYNK